MAFGKAALGKVEDITRAILVLRGRRVLLDAELALLWQRFSHKNRTQLPSHLQPHDSKRLVRASGIFDSHRPLHFQPSLANASQLSF
jgi:hypothetical protein